MAENLDYLTKEFMMHQDIFGKLGNSKLTNRERYAALRDNLVVRQPIYMVDMRTLGVKQMRYGGCINGTFILVPTLEEVSWDTKATSLLHLAEKHDDLHDMLLSSFHGTCKDFTKMAYLSRQVAEREIKAALLNTLSVYSDDSFAMKIRGMRHSDIMVSYLSASEIKYEVGFENSLYDKRLLIGNKDEPLMVIDSIDSNTKPYVLYVERGDTELVKMLETSDLEQLVTAIQVVASEQGIVLT